MTQAEIEAREERGRERMLAEELAALWLLRALVRSRLKSKQDLRAATARLAIALAASRGSARAASLDELRDATRLDVVRVSGRGDFDAARSARAATGWQVAVQRYLDEGAVVSDAIAAADYKLSLSAATEVAQAYNEERILAARELERSSGIELYKAFDATNDKRTCPVCERAHGTIVHVSESFPEGEPPIHPRCRCNATILTAAEAGKYRAA